MKLLKCIRHGFALHNEYAKKMGEKAYYMEECLDSHLTSEGIKQALDLHNNDVNGPSEPSELNELDYVFVSPLYRTLQTAEILFTGMEKDIIVLDLLKEYPNATHTTNKRKTKTYLKSRFPKFNFNELAEQDITYNNECLETKEELEVRIKKFKNYLNKPIYMGKRIGVIGHTTFLSNLIWRQDKDMEHCKIYEKLLF